MHWLNLYVNIAITWITELRRIYGLELMIILGLSVDMEKIYLRNMANKHAFRKNNIIINTGDNMT